MRFQLPHPFVLLLAAVGIAAALTWLIPAGEYQRRDDPETGRTVVIAGTYAPMAATPVGPLAALLAVPRGIIAGADVIVTILFVGGAFALLDATGALARLVGALIGVTRRPRTIVILVSLAFATLGALENMQEEIVALVPVLILLSRGLGFGSVTALAMSAGTAAVATWIAWTLAVASHDDLRQAQPVATSEPATARDGVLLALVLAPFIPYVFGVLRLDWGFNELSALFLVVGFAVGLVSGRDLATTTTGFLKGMEAMLAASLFVGVARAISLVLTDGRVIDTIVYSLAVPLAHFPGTVAALLMVPMHAVLHLPVPSVSGQAVLTMPIMAPLADLLGVPRDATVIAYQTGAGLADLVVPTNGALLAMLLSAGVPYGRWLRFAVPGALLVGVIGAIGVVLSA